MHFAAISAAGATVSQWPARQDYASLFPNHFSSLGGQKYSSLVPRPSSLTSCHVTCDTRSSASLRVLNEAGRSGDEAIKETQKVAGNEPPRATATENLLGLMPARYALTFRSVNIRKACYHRLGQPPHHAT